MIRLIKIDDSRCRSTRPPRTEQVRALEDEIQLFSLSLAERPWVRAPRQYRRGVRK